MRPAPSTTACRPPRTVAPARAPWTRGSTRLRRARRRHDDPSCRSPLPRSPGSRSRIVSVAPGRQGADLGWYRCRPWLCGASESNASTRWARRSPEASAREPLADGRRRPPRGRTSRWVRSTACAGHLDERGHRGRRGGAGSARAGVGEAAGRGLWDLRQRSPLLPRSGPQAAGHVAGPRAGRHRRGRASRPGGCPLRRLPQRHVRRVVRLLPERAHPPVRQGRPGHRPRTARRARRARRCSPDQPGPRPRRGRPGHGVAHRAPGRHGARGGAGRRTTG